MNYEFLETKFFYNSQHSGQGEKPYDDTHHSAPAESLEPQQSTEPGVMDQINPNLEFEVSNSYTHELSDEIHMTELSDEIYMTELSDEIHMTDNNDETVTPQVTEQVEHVQDQVETPQEEIIPRYTLPPRTTRGIPPKRYSPGKQSATSRFSIANIAKGNITKEAKAFAFSVYTNQIPPTVEQAMKSKHWENAMKAEMEALRKNDTWERCNLPAGKRPVGCRWVFTIKYKPDGTIERYKTRIVAKGYTQTYGIDYSKHSRR